MKDLLTTLLATSSAALLGLGLAQTTFNAYVENISPSEMIQVSRKGRRPRPLPWCMGRSHLTRTAFQKRGARLR